jgi:hypothetical protein
VYWRERKEGVMKESPIPRLSPEDGNPASDLKTDIIKDVEREHTITGDVVGPRAEEIPDEESDLPEQSRASDESR